MDEDDELFFARLEEEVFDVAEQDIWRSACSSSKVR